MLTFSRAECELKLISRSRFVLLEYNKKIEKVWKVLKFETRILEPKPNEKVTQIEGDAEPAEHFAEKKVEKSEN